MYFLGYEKENIDMNILWTTIQTPNNLIPKHIRFWNIII